MHTRSSQNPTAVVAPVHAVPMTTLTSRRRVTKPRLDNHPAVAAVTAKSKPIAKKQPHGKAVNPKSVAAAAVAAQTLSQAKSSSYHQVPSSPASTSTDYTLPLSPSPSSSSSYSSSFSTSPVRPGPASSTTTSTASAVPTKPLLPPCTIVPASPAKVLPLSSSSAPKARNAGAAVPTGRETHHARLVQLLSPHTSVATYTADSSSTTATSTAGGVSNGGNRAVYACGTPGTGKTLTVKAVLRTLRASRPDMRQIFVNCGSMSNGVHLLTFIAESLGLLGDDKSNQNGSGAGAAGVETIMSKLIAYATSQQQGENQAIAPVLIVVDEIDLLLQSSSSSATPGKTSSTTPSSATNNTAASNKTSAAAASNAAALYALFELPTLANSPFRVLSVANALDLPTRLLPLLSDSVSARPVVLQFLAYGADALARIATVEASSAVAALPRLAVTLAAKKVAACGGDARLMLSIIRQAYSATSGNSSTPGGGAKKSAVAIVAAIATAKGSAQASAVETIRTLPIQQQLALVVAANAVTFADRDRNSSKKMHQTTTRPSSSPARTMTSKAVVRRAGIVGLFESFKRMCARVNLPPPLFADFAELVSGPLTHHALVDVVGSSSNGGGGGVGGAGVGGSRRGGGGQVSKRRTGSGGRTGAGGVATLGAQQVRLRVPVDDVRAGVQDNHLLARLMMCGPESSG